jgi:hypothetical protein
MRKALTMIIGLTLVVAGLTLQFCQAAPKPPAGEHSRRINPSGFAIGVTGMLILRRRSKAGD